jgi:hypothetical protein
MGLRAFGRGRVALLSVYYHFLFGSGTKWLFDRQILSSGDGGSRPSDMEKLILATLRWLSQPSMRNASSGIGGYVTPRGRLLYPNMLQETKDEMNETHFPYNKSSLSSVSVSGLQLMKGLVGAQSMHGGGAATVSDYAAAVVARGESVIKC